MKPFQTIPLAGMQIARLRESELIELIAGQLSGGRGGWLVTANLDFLARFARDPGARRLYDQADVTVADGMPLLWAARLQGSPLPERVAGSDLVSSLAERAAQDGRSIFLLGGNPGAAEGARDALQRRWPDLTIAGVSSPQISTPPTAEQIQGIAEELEQARPDIVYVAFGSPKQEELIEQLRTRLPQTWWMGVGASLSFLAGEVSRAPVWMQTNGLEWLHRLLGDPGRMAKRYFVENLPFLVHLLIGSWRNRKRELVREISL